MAKHLLDGGEDRHRLLLPQQRRDADRPVLHRRIVGDPADPAGWRMLGWSYFETGDLARSAGAPDPTSLAVQLLTLIEGAMAGVLIDRHPGATRHATELTQIALAAAALTFGLFGLLGSGSIRIHDRELQERVFAAVGAGAAGVGAGFLAGVESFQMAIGRVRAWWAGPPNLAPASRRHHVTLHVTRHAFRKRSGIPRSSVRTVTSAATTCGTRQSGSGPRWAR